MQYLTNGDQKFLGPPLTNLLSILKFKNNFARECTREPAATPTEVSYVAAYSRGLPDLPKSQTISILSFPYQPLDVYNNRHV